MAADAGSQMAKPQLSWKQDNHSPGSPSSHFDKTIMGLPLLIWEADKYGQIRFLEDTSKPQGTNTGKIKIQGISIYDYFSEVPALGNLIKQALLGQPSKAIIDGDQLTLDCSVFPKKNPTGEIYGVVGICFETSQKQIQIWLQQAVVRVSTALRQASDHQQMPSLIITELERILDIDRAALVTRGNQPAGYQLDCGWGKWAKGLNYSPSLEEILTEKSLISSINGCETYSEGKLLNSSDSAQVLGSPLVAQGNIVGALWIGREDFFSEAEKQLIQSVSEISANALLRSRQHKLTQQRLERIAALHSIDQAISGNFNLNLTLNIILDQVVSQLDVDAADIFLFDGDTQQLSFAEGRGFRKYQPQQGTSQAWEGLVWRVVQKRDLVSIPHLRKESPTLVRSGMFAAEGFQAYFAVPLIAKGKIQGVLEVFNRTPADMDGEWYKFLRTLGTQAAIAMDNASLVENLRRTNLKLDQAYQATLEGWVKALDLKDKSTQGHTKRVVEQTMKLARAVSIPEKKLIHVRRGALLHDIGKLGIPDHILNKPGPLNEGEWVLMRQHPCFAKEMLEPIDFLHEALHIPFSHHEKWDGSGYPQGLKGESIPLEARVFAVIDVWDALRSDRPYRSAWEPEKTHQFIRQQAGIHFDPLVVKIWERTFQISS